MNLRIGAALDFFGSEKGKRVLIICGAAVMALLLISSFIPSGSESAPITAAEDSAQTEREIEKRLAELIEQIDGAGSAAVMVTLDTTSKRQYAEERRTSTSTGENTKTATEDITLAAAGSGKEALETGMVLPQIRGVAVVCAGAADPQVKEKIANAVCGALGIKFSRVCVTY